MENNTIKDEPNFDYAIKLLYWNQATEGERRKIMEDNYLVHIHHMQILVLTHKLTTTAE